MESSTEKNGDDVLHHVGVHEYFNNSMDNDLNTDTNDQAHSTESPGSLQTVDVRVQQQEQMLSRFRLHKQHQHEKDDWLKKSKIKRALCAQKCFRDEAKVNCAKPSIGGILGSPSITEMSGVDHNNTPHRWKDAKTILKENEVRSFQKMLKKAEPIRPYPGKLRGKKSVITVSLGGENMGEYCDSSNLTLTNYSEIRGCLISNSKPINLEHSKPAKDSNISAGNDNRNAVRETGNPADFAINRIYKVEPAETELIAEPKEYLKLDQSDFPLSLFDSDEYERHSPEEWLLRCTEGHALYFFKNEWRWRPCDIHGFDPVKKKYVVQFRGFDMKQKNVARINLRFNTESQLLFEARIESAVQRREEAKSALRFDHYLTTWTSDALSSMNQFTLKNIHRRVADGLPDDLNLNENSPASVLLCNLTDTAINEYTRAMKKSVILYQFNWNPSMREKFVALRVLPPAPQPSTPYFGKKQIPNHPYIKCKKIINTSYLSLSPRLYSVLLRMYVGWDKKFEKLLLVNTNFNVSSAEAFTKYPNPESSISDNLNVKIKHNAGINQEDGKVNSAIKALHDMEANEALIELPLRLLDFKAIQETHSNKAEEILLIDWRRTVIENVIDNLQDHYDFFISDVKKYAVSQLKSIITNLELRLQAQLRHIVYNSIDNWVAFVRKTTIIFTDYKCSTSTTECGRLDISSRRSHGATVSPKNSLFMVDLIICNCKIALDPSPIEITNEMLGPLNAITSTLNEFDAIDCDMMSLLNLDRRRLLNLHAPKIDEDLNIREIVKKITIAKQKVTDMVAVALESAHSLIIEYSEHAKVVEFDAQQFLNDLDLRYRASKNHDKQAVSDKYDVSNSENGRNYLNEICNQIRRFHNFSHAAGHLSYDKMPFSLVCVSTASLKQTLRAKAIDIRDTLINHVVKNARARSVMVVTKYEAILQQINEKPINEAQLAKLKAFVQESKSIVASLKREVNGIHDHLNALDEFSHKISEEDLMLAYSAKEWPLRVARATDSCDSALEIDKIRMIDKLALEKESFEHDLEKYKTEVASFKLYGDIEKTEKYVELAVNLYDSLQDAKAKASNFNEREEVFNFPPTEYSLLQRLDEEFTPYYKLWTMCSEFNQSRTAWLNGPFLELKGTEIDQLVSEWHKYSYKLSKSLANDAPGSAEVALTLRERTTEFKAYLPIIQSLASPALQERHWDSIRQKVGLEDTEEELTLMLLLENRIMDHIEEIQEIGVFAEKEYSLMSNLNNMIVEWEKVEFECVAYKETGTHIIKSTEDIIALLDDHIIKTQTMRGSPYIKCIEKDCKAWEKKLQYAQQLIDEWMSCQRTWLYLEAIFSSEDIMRQMPTEARRFASVDALWRKTMEDTVADPSFMTVIGMEKLLVKFHKANEKLDEIQKGLNDYLEMKRLFFPRFFFLSNDELLEILSQTKDPRAVQPHLGKCFEGINRVVFTDPGLVITDISSAESECVKLRQHVETESSKNKGNVEMWLLEVEQSQWDSVRDHTERAVGTYPKEIREEWILKWPAQVVLAASQVYWTQDVTRAIQTKGTQGLREYLQVLNSQLNRIVVLVRGQLSKLERTTIGALVVIDVHARDTIAHMIEKGVVNDQDFEWISQLRYYWLDSIKSKKKMDLQARIVNARVNYGYEYLGNTMRLVITPLTDRCYRTMMGAVDLLYGGAPEGPAGTGKTETVKDLSKAIAIQCVVFNCSDGLDYLAMAKFFKGLAGCGSWCCFDEFNRINIEVLSVIAQQILTINEGKKACVDKLLFEGTYIKLNVSANVFITMNPGYAGRAELPDNLKALFRPCAMMVPDYALIAEIRLYSFGFADARSNARKLTQVLQLSSEQLSSQKHYDYGMRAVNSILVAAGALRQTLGSDPFWSEDKIVLRSIQDVNLPKFTSDDLPLFRGITSDLFPGAILPEPDHGALVPMIDKVCENGISIVPDVIIPLECKPEFKMKVIQFYETVQVRHGLMIVGQTGSGKSCIIHTLATAMTNCYNESEGTIQKRVMIHTMNPKSITSGQLYGNFDENTHEWSDGVLACTYRECAKDASSDLQWVMFDGPVDAVWIENMNTVLDDNKKLCLMSGEIVKMTERMRMMFETEDLEEASPATVSRVGMVFVEPKVLGWEILMRTWLKIRLTETLRHKKGVLEESILWLVPPMLYFVEKHCVVPTQVTSLEHVASLLRLLECFLTKFCDDYGGNFTKLDVAMLDKVLEGLVMKAVIWSIGACIDSNSRITFDSYFRNFVSGSIRGSVTADEPAGTPTSSTVELPNRAHNVAYHIDFRSKNLQYGDLDKKASLLEFPAEGLVYDYCFDTKAVNWKNWLDHSVAFNIPKDAQYTFIHVPTIDTERSAWLLDQLLRKHFHVLCTGETGTGKSVVIKKKILTGLNKNFIPVFMSFSAQTSANQTQDIIESKLDRRRKGVLGPPVGMSTIIFVDDLNMPAKETYGAQPPIELLRQWMGHGGWYNRKDNSFTQLVDIQFISAMGPPGGGRTKITQRYIRYFNLINFVSFDDNSLKAIFNSITNWFTQGYSRTVKILSSAIVDATVEVYNAISTALLPTPTKSHYTFNLRDLSKVFQGIAQVSNDELKDGTDFVRLWSHECLRVFSDRLINESDRAWFDDVIIRVVREKFGMNYVSENVLGPHSKLIYGNFGDAKATQRSYSEIRDRTILQNSMATYLEDYNNTSSAPMSLVLFQNAIEHIARISRVIHQPFGNALLVGVGGSGRKSVTALAVYIAEYKLYQIEITKSYSYNEWRNDLKKILQLTGVNNQPLVFLFSDTQIVEESYLEDINGILNTGEVANLWSNEELVAISEALDHAASAAGVNASSNTELYNFFVSRCRTNLHVVLALSPIGDAFRRRLRMFPSLVNCCTIDWYSEWPDEALRSVANYFFEDIELSSTLKTGLVEVCVQIQEQMSQITGDFLQSLRRHYYITPTSYLELINTFKKLLNTKRTEIMMMKNRYDNGLTKLMDTAVQVESMQVELEALQPMLKVATTETDALLETISREQKEANITKDIVAEEEKQCNDQAAAANAIKDSCEAELAEAIPALSAAVKALQTLTKGDITEIKAMKKPPDGVKLVMEAVCIMMKVAPIRVPDPSGGNKKVDDYWIPAQKNLLSDTKFLQNLLDYDKDNIPPEAMEKVKPYASNPDFSAEKIKKASVAASGLCSWVHAMIVYDRVAKVVGPKREALKAATVELDKAQSDLKSKQDALQLVLDKVAKLESDLSAAFKKKEDLQFQVDDCSKKLVRATQLIGGLGGEKSRWNDLSSKLQIVYDNAIGDIMLASGVIAYLGAFTSVFRDKAIANWSKQLRAKDITCSDNFSLSMTLGDPVRIREWTIAKLPNDSFSIENALMLHYSNRWPLMIDPQGQANRWVKNMEEQKCANALKVVKQSQAGFVRLLENSIMSGAAVLIENILEEIDPILEPILLKQIVKTSSGGAATIRLGDSTLEYDMNFRLYMTTKLSNPHYPPETCVKVNLLNFMATEEGLQDQMLGIVVAKEEASLETQREKLVLEDAQHKKTLKEIEDKILFLLQTAEGNILNDERLIDTLGASKVTANKIEEKVREAAITQKMIAEKRQGYAPVAFRSSQLFFCIADLTVIDPMYQYALEWFISLFVHAISVAEKSPTLATRLKNLNATFTYVLYRNVCRSLFEKDKLLFAFLLTVKIQVGCGAISNSELRYFFTGNTQMEHSEPKPHGMDSWVSDKMWGNILGFYEMPQNSPLIHFPNLFKDNVRLWEKGYNSPDPAEIIRSEILPQFENIAKYDIFQQLVILRVLRPDKVIPVVMSYVATEMGQRFIDPQPFDLRAGYEASKCTSPLIFVLSPGADPMSELLKLAVEMGFQKKFIAISLGQGQGPLAENAIAEAIDNGTWVCLQNCHLSVSWLPTLEKICEEISPERVHSSFRLWLTSEPTQAFPSFILQNGVKMTNEPPKGMRANLKGSYSTLTEDWFESCGRPKEFKKLLFGLCFFHAIVRERIKFGPLGWNIKYVFSTSDLSISKDQLKIFLDELDGNEAIPYAALAYLAGECNYGGRVTDDKDRRCIVNILSDFYTPLIQSDNYKFSKSGIYYAPPDGILSTYTDYIDSMPMNEGPEIFGLHENANISCAIAETNLLLESALALQPRSSGSSGKSWDDVLGETVKEIAEKIPQLFDIEKAELQFPVCYSESMNTVLTQELIRFNRLISVLTKSLKDIQRALKGLVVLSSQLEAMGNSMVIGQVPLLWSSVAYPSLKPLGSWVTDFLQRLTFLQKWLDSGSSPSVYWISGFFFTQAFITGTLQNFARKHQFPIDQVGYDMVVQSDIAISVKADDGAYIDGLFMEGARWDYENMCVQESRHRELHVSMPVIHLLPKRREDIEPIADTDSNGTAHIYLCPVYKTSVRQGTLSTTGHSTNFVMFIRLPMAKHHRQKHWIRRGVAMLTQLDT